MVTIERSLQSLQYEQIIKISFQKGDNITKKAHRTNYYQKMSLPERKKHYGPMPVVFIELWLLCESSNFGGLMNASGGREDERAAVLLVGLQRLDTGREDERVAVHFVQHFLGDLCTVHPVRGVPLCSLILHQQLMTWFIH